MRRKSSDTAMNRKIITLKNFTLIDGYVKDFATQNDSNDSAVIEGILLDRILPKSQASSYYIQRIYEVGLKETFISLMQNLSAGVQFKASHTNGLPLMKLAMSILNRPFSSGFDSDYEHLLEGHFQANCQALIKKLEKEAKEKEMSFNEKMLLEDDIMLLSLTITNSVDFVPYNYFRMIISRWDTLCDYSFTYRLAYDIVSLSAPNLWDSVEYRLRAISVITECCEKWEVY